MYGWQKDMSGIAIKTCTDLIAATLARTINDVQVSIEYVGWSSWIDGVFAQLLFE